MMDMATRHKVNAPHVIHEIIDGEAVIINLKTGIYYSIDAIGAEIWSLVAAGAATAEVTAGIASRFTGNSDEIERGVLGLIRKLAEEELILVDEESRISASVALPDRAPLAAFNEPKLQKYTDMEDLLVLDPIHDVDETGWPTARRDDK
jgi:hypothetical protein